MQLSILNLNENGRKTSKKVENNVGKGEIARCKQFHLFSHFFFFSKNVFGMQAHRNQGLFWKGLQDLHIISFIPNKETTGEIFSSEATLVFATTCFFSIFLY